MPNLQELDKALINLSVDHLLRYGMGSVDKIHPEDREVLEHWLASHYFQALMRIYSANKAGPVEDALKLGFLAGFRAHQTMQDLAVAEVLEQHYGQ